MTRDDVIAMAREAAARHGHTLKAVPEQATVEFITELVAMATSAEREACAKDAEAFHHHGYDFTGNLELHEWLRARPTGHKES